MTDFHILIREGLFGVGEALRCARLAGLRHVGLITSADGNFTHMAEICTLVDKFSLYSGIDAWAGVELRHIPPALLPDMVNKARNSGAELVLVRGEGLDGLAEQGTNLAAVATGADILTCPGLLDPQTAAFAAEKGVAVELTSSPEHALANAHVASMALQYGIPLVRGSAARSAEKIPAQDYWRMVLGGADVFGKKEGSSRLLTLIHRSEEALIRTLRQRKRQKI